MTTRPLYEQDEWDIGCSNSLAAPSITLPSIVHHEETPTSPRLEVADLDDAVPFSQKFSDLFDSLGLHIPPSSVDKKNRMSRSLDVSYEIENYADIKYIDPQWKHDNIEEIVLMSPKRNAFDLSTIHEEPSILQVPSACLTDFNIEEPDTRCGLGLSFRTNTCTRKDNGRRYIIKRKQTRNDSSWSEKVVLETLASLSLPFVDTIRWTFRNEEYVYIVLDQYPAGTLLDLINHHGPLGSHKATFYASELVSAILSLHNAGIMHKELDPRNIALDADGHIVITNFSRAESFPQVARPHGVSCTAGFGDTMSEFRAPEIFLGWALDSAVDCWSFGMLFYFMMFGTHPYGDREGIDDPRWLYDCVVVFLVPTESLRLVHPMARDLITKCLQRNPSLRWSMEKIKSHGYFALVDWDQVAAKQVDAPSFRRTAMEVDRAAFQIQIASDSQQKHVSSNGLLPDSHYRPKLNETVSAPPSRPHTITSTNSRSRTIAELSNASEIFRPLSISTIPEALHEEDDPVSLSASTGHIESERDETSMAVNLEPTDHMSRFWAELDQEEQQSAVSVVTLEFGGSNNIPHTKVPKLRKYRSAIHAQRLFSLSTSSFQKKLRQKPKSSATLRPTRLHAEPIDNLPLGLHQSGSGIGFTYNIPAGVPSKASVRSFAPSCNHLFHGGFTTALNLGLGLGHSPRLGLKTKGKPDLGPSPASHHDDPAAARDRRNSPSTQPAVPPRPAPPRSREVGNGTFIRDMYRTPSWILSPPDSLPSPMALVNPPDRDHYGHDSPLAASSDSSGPYTPATLVEDSGNDVGGGNGNECDGEHEHEHDEECPEEVNISIPKDLELELDFRMWAPDSTLRLVPSSAAAAIVVGQTTMATRTSLSYDDIEEDSFYTEVTTSSTRAQ